MSRFRKEWLVSQSDARASRASLVAVAYAGNMRAAERDRVRAELAAVGASTSFIKNSLVRRALADSPLAPLVPLVRGPAAVIAGDADAAIAERLLALGKASADFFLLGAVLQQRLLLQHTEIERLATLPPAQTVHSELIAAMQPGGCLQIPGPPHVLRLPNPAQYLLALLEAHARG